MSKAYNDIGRLLRGDKKYDEALDYYVLDRDLCRKHQDIIEEAEATRMIGEVYVEQGRFTEGLKHHKQYLSMAIQLQNRVSEQRALATLSWTYLAWSTAEPSRLAKALQYSQKSHAAVARIASKDVDRSERAQMTGRAAENIGKINWRLGDVSEAEESFCEAETSYRGYRHWEDLHRLAVTRAGLVLNTGAEAELGRALAQCRVSLEAAHKLRDPASAEANVDSLVTMFKVHLSMKQFDDARDCLVKARHHSKEDKNVIHHLKMMTVISDSVKMILSGNSDQVTHRPYEQIADALVRFEVQEDCEASAQVLQDLPDASVRAVRGRGDAVQAWRVRARHLLLRRVPDQRARRRPEQEQLAELGTGGRQLGVRACCTSTPPLPCQARLRGVLHPDQEVRGRDHPARRRERGGQRPDQAGEFYYHIYCLFLIVAAKSSYIHKTI